MSKEPVVRTYRESDLAACRGLWAENTQRHRELYDDQSIGGDEPGLEFDEHLARVGADNIWLACNDSRVLAMAGLIPGEQPELEPVVVTESARGPVSAACWCRLSWPRRSNGAFARSLFARWRAMLRLSRSSASSASRPSGKSNLFARPGGKPRWSRPGARIAGVDLDI